MREREARGRERGRVKREQNIRDARENDTRAGSERRKEGKNKKKRSKEGKVY